MNWKGPKRKQQINGTLILESVLNVTDWLHDWFKIFVSYYMIDYRYSYSYCQLVESLTQEIYTILPHNDMRCSRHILLNLNPFGVNQWLLSLLLSIYLNSSDVDVPKRAWIQKRCLIQDERRKLQDWWLLGWHLDQILH